MKDSELQIDRSCHVLYSKPCKKEIRAKIALHYPCLLYTSKELQLLGKKLLTEYVIKIGNIEVEPLWVEAYYSNISKKFSDPFIHGKEEQSKFCVLYFHHNTDDSRSEMCIRDRCYDKIGKLGLRGCE